MKNETNIYDIDGKLIRSASNNEEFTLNDLREKIQYYAEKLKNTDEKDPKYNTYKNYLENLQKWVYSHHFKELLEEMKAEKTLDEQVKDAINTLKSDLDNDGQTEGDTTNEVQERITGDNGDITNKELGDDETVGRKVSDIHEERPTSQSDLLVERTNVTNVMDEYVTPIEDEDNIQ